MGRGSGAVQAVEGASRHHPGRFHRGQAGDSSVTEAIAHLDRPGKKILSIDGGGIRGVIPATILAEMERRSGKPVAEMFDMIAGTSTGAIIALALTIPGPDGHPQWTAQDLVNLYDQEGPEIFHRSLWQRIRSLGGLVDAKYTRTALDRTLETYLADAKLSDALTDVIIPAYETQHRRPFFFRSARAMATPKRDFLMRDVARAASAAPTYFEPVALTNHATGKTYSLIDGGVFANNPGMVAWAEMQRRHPGAKISLLSLGTGERNQPLPAQKIKHWGLVRWAQPVLDVVFDGVSSTTDYELGKLLGSDYLRLQAPLTQASERLDDASTNNLADLHHEAEAVLNWRGSEIDAFTRSRLQS
jgi:patatin-like phospholipase/acyl hydrolase